jgi:hypothetical protein
MNPLGEKIHKYIVFQAQSLKDHAIAVKKHFKHNDYVRPKYFFRNCFVNKCGLKNDTKKFSINKESI